MCVLSDRDIVARIHRGDLVIEPLGPDAIQPATVDVRLGATMLYRDRVGIIDPLEDQHRHYRPAPFDAERGVWVLWPEKLYLGVTLERIVVPDDLLCRLDGKSTLGRLGIGVHKTAGVVDPGWHGPLTLEIEVSDPTYLRPGMPIGQVSFERLVSACAVPYGHPARRSKYQGGTELRPGVLDARMDARGDR